jgi:hypothetical protein
VACKRVSHGIDELSADIEVEHGGIDRLPA